MTPAPDGTESIWRWIKPRLTRSNLRNAAIASCVLALVIVFFWPRSGFSVPLVTLATVFGVCAGLLCALTYWHTARVQIGRRGLRYKTVRRKTAIAASIGLSFLLIRVASISLDSRSADRPGQVKAVPTDERLPIAIAQLQGDKGRSVENTLMSELGRSGPPLPITIFKVDQTFGSGPLPKASQFFNHLNAADTLGQKGAYLMLWGSVDKARGVVQLYETALFDGGVFGGSFMPSDFKLPALPVNDLAPVLWLILAEQSSNVNPQNQRATAAALSLPLEKVRRLVAAHRTDSSWNADTAARVNFVLARLTGMQGELMSDDRLLRIAIVDYLSAITGWAAQEHALDRAMALRCLAESLGGLSNLHYDRAADEAAVNAYRKGSAIYAAAGATQDAALVQLMMGQTLAVMARNDNGKELPQVVDAYQSALKVFDKARYPQQWADVQYNVAVNLANQGTHEADSQHLRDAVAILNEVLMVRMRDQVPHKWAITQMTLGEALQQLGRRDPTASYYADAVTAEKSALEVLRPDNDPRSWSQAETDLGAALSGIGMRDGSREEVQQAIDAIRAGATDEYRQREPYLWLQAQSTLVMALEQLGSLEMYQESLDESNSDALDRSSREHLEEAVTTARASIPEAARDGNKIAWAYLQGKLGTSLEVIGVSEEANGKYEATEHLKEAVEAERAALQVTTMESDPENWADTQDTLGDALQELGKRERNTNDLEQAIASYQEAAKVQTRDRDPISWAATQNSIANTYEVLGMREPSAGGIVHLQQAVAAYEAALTVSTPDNDPVNWPISQDNLARTQSELGEREAGTNYLQQAAASYREELKYLSPDRSPTRWKDANEGLNNVLNLLRSRGVSG